MLGPAGTGKSVMAQVTTAMVGKESTVTTSLKALHSNDFEPVNLIGKRLM